MRPDIASSNRPNGVAIIYLQCKAACKAAEREYARQRDLEAQRVIVQARTRESQTKTGTHRARCSSTPIAQRAPGALRWTPLRIVSPGLIRGATCPGRTSRPPSRDARPGCRGGSHEAVEGSTRGGDRPVMIQPDRVSETRSGVMKTLTPSRVIAAASLMLAALSFGVAYASTGSGNGPPQGAGPACVHGTALLERNKALPLRTTRWRSTRRSPRRPSRSTAATCTSSTTRSRRTGSRRSSTS